MAGGDAEVLRMVSMLVSQINLDQIEIVRTTKIQRPAVRNLAGLDVDFASL